MPTDKSKTRWRTYIFTVFLKDCPKPIIITSFDGEIHACIPGYILIIDFEHNEKMFNNNEVVAIYKDFK